MHCGTLERMHTEDMKEKTFLNEAVIFVFFAHKRYLSHGLF